jgi:threonine dehydratase
MPLPVTRADVDAAWAVIRPHVRRTPVIEVAAEDLGLSGPPVAFKLEFLQHTGSFKARGAMLNLLTRDMPKAGVAAASGGNHGAAVAWAAARAGVPANIFVPAISSPAKIARIESYGATLHVGGAAYAEALAACERSRPRPAPSASMPTTPRKRSRGRGPRRANSPRMRSRHHPRRHRRRRAHRRHGGLGRRHAPDRLGRARDLRLPPRGARRGAPGRRPGLRHRHRQPRRAAGGRAPFEVARAHVAAAVTVPDDAIRAARALALGLLRIVTEPGGATALAGLLSGAYRPGPGERIGVLLCGANTGAVSFDGRRASGGRRTTSTR